MRRFHGLAQASGMLVLEVAEGGPASVAGVVRGDVIVGFDREVVAGVDDMHRALTAERAGRAVTLRLLRRAKMLAVTVVPGEA